MIINTYANNRIAYAEDVVVYICMYIYKTHANT